MTTEIKIEIGNHIMIFEVTQPHEEGSLLEQENSGLAISAFESITENKTEIEQFCGIAGVQTSEFIMALASKLSNLYSTTNVSSVAIASELNDVMREKFPSIQVCPSLRNHLKEDRDMDLDKVEVFYEGQPIDPYDIIVSYNEAYMNWIVQTPDRISLLFNISSFEIGHMHDGFAEIRDYYRWLQSSAVLIAISRPDFKPWLGYNKEFEFDILGFSATDGEQVMIPVDKAHVEILKNNDIEDVGEVKKLQEFKQSVLNVGYIVKSL